MENFDLEDYKVDEDKIRKIQALWRGAYVRLQMLNVKEAYKALFAKLENKTSVKIQWLSRLSRPRFILTRNDLKLSKPKLEQFAFSCGDQPSSILKSVEEIQSAEKPINVTSTDCLKNVTNQPLGDEVENKEINSLEVPSTPAEIKNSTESLTALDQQLSGFTEKVSIDVATVEEQRRNLALELLWLQQAIVSRKQYLRHKTKIIQQDC